jgi:hypothetical protein
LGSVRNSSIVGVEAEIYKSAERSVNKILAVCDQSCVVWDVTPCSPSKISRRFGEQFRLSLLGRRISETRNKRKIGSNKALLAACSTLVSIDFQRTARRFIEEDRTLR